MGPQAPSARARGHPCSACKGEDNTVLRDRKLDGGAPLVTPDGQTVFTFRVEESAESATAWNVADGKKRFTSEDKQRAKQNQPRRQGGRGIPPPRLLAFSLDGTLFAWFQELRALEVREALPGAAATQALQVLARNAAHHPLTVEAKASLARRGFQKAADERTDSGRHGVPGLPGGLPWRPRPEGLARMHRTGSRPSARPLELTVARPCPPCYNRQYGRRAVPLESARFPFHAHSPLTRQAFGLTPQRERVTQGRGFSPDHGSLLRR